MDQVTFADVLQKSFIAMSMGATDRITTINIIVNVTMSFIVGMFVFYVYKRTYQGVLYQKSFNISLVLASVVTSLIIMTISGNLILSLGMVGALSIVRFRTPIKDSMDLIFLFWAISVGIANGVGYFNISIVGSILITIFLLILTRDSGKASGVFLLVVQANTSESEEEAIKIIESNSDSFSIKSKILSNNLTETTVEFKVDDDSPKFLDSIQKIEGVGRVTLVAYEQDLSSV